MAMIDPKKVQPYPVTAIDVRDTRTPIERAIDQATGYDPTKRERETPRAIGRRVADDAIDHLSTMYPACFGFLTLQARKSLRGFIANRVAYVVEQEREVK